MKNKPFWTVAEAQAPRAFSSFKDTPPVRKPFKVPSLKDQCFADTIEACPHCGSVNLTDLESPADGVMEILCNDCTHQWMGIHPFDI